MTVEAGGRARLAERIAALPDLLHEALAAGAPDLGFRPKRGARVVTTGLGSSAAQARFLAQVLDEAGIAARFAPLGALREPARGVGAKDILVVFSQGLSPNARLAFGALDRFAHAVLVTASAADDPAAIPQEKRELVELVRRRGVAIVPFGGAEEYGSLLRVTGPMLGLTAALRLAASLGAIAERAASANRAESVNRTESAERAARVARAVAEAPERLRRECADLDVSSFDGALSFLATGGYAECIWNLRFKVLEGMLRPLPPVWDPIEVAHGPFQQACAEPTTFLALTRPDAWNETELLDRLVRILPAESRLHRLRAELPGALATFEHEAMLNALVLRYLDERGIDPDDWPGRGRDGPMYEVGRSEPSKPSILAVRGSGHALEALAWPDVERLLAGAVETAVLPLGSIEQHGPHLPFATDAWIAEALAERFCARLPEAIRLPVLPFGCAREHLAFPGTLSLEEATLAAVLDDLAGSLVEHGVARLLLLSAHGGNDAALAAILPKLREKHASLDVIVAPGPGALLPLLQEEGERLGVAAGAAGLHAGEIETSILLALAPESVRAERFAPGVVDTAPPPADLFHPSLRTHAPDGTVGDPRGADAARAERYLDVWLDAIEKAYRREKNRKYANGTQKA